jgi:hypothetical protein
MPIDLAEIYEAVMSGLGTVPSALIAAALLAGPTAIWLIARFVNPPDLGMTDEVVVEELLWVCPHCRSINEERIATCYRCHKVRADESIPLVIETVPTRLGPGVGIAVGPGVPMLAPVETWIEREVARASEAVDDGVEPEEDLVAAEPAPLTYEPVILEPLVRASGRPGAGESAGRRTRRKPPDSGDATPKRARKTGSG